MFELILLKILNNYTNIIIIINKISIAPFTEASKRFTPLSYKHTCSKMTISFTLTFFHPLTLIDTHVLFAFN